MKICVNTVLGYMSSVANSQAFSVRRLWALSHTLMPPDEISCQITKQR